MTIESKLLKNLFVKTLLAGVMAAGLAACGGGSGSGGSSGSGDASLTLGITDAPVDEAEAVVITFDTVELQGPERETITFDEAKTINLLDLQGTEQELLLDSYVLPAGEYQWIRLGVIEDPALTYIQVAGEQYPLEIPSNAQTGLKLNRGFTLAAGGVTSFTIDFDLRKSVHQQGTGDYKLRPTLRIVDTLEASNIMGTVAESLIIDENCNNGDNNDMGNSVYLYSGADVTPLDVQGAETDPLASANVVYNSETLEWEFTLGFVAEGDYTLAFTCDASLDVSDEDNSDVVMFPSTANITIVADEDANVDMVPDTL